jgi:nicotinamidase-related amidase
MSGRALLLLDLTEQTTTVDGLFGKLIDPAESLDAVCAASHAALATARASNDLVVWVTPGAEFVRRVANGRELDERDSTLDPRVGAPATDEPVVPKDGISGFAGGELERVLATRAVHVVALAGIATQYVIKDTAEDALKLGLEVRILEDCCTDISVEAHRATLDALRPECQIGPARELFPADPR